jgi:hypothetical protein
LCVFNTVVCVFITAVPITKLFARGGKWRTCATRDYNVFALGVESVLLEGCPGTMTGVSQYWFSGHFRQVFSTGNPHKTRKQRGATPVKQSGNPHKTRKQRGAPVREEDEVFDQGQTQQVQVRGEEYVEVHGRAPGRQALENRRSWRRIVQIGILATPSWIPSIRFCTSLSMWRPSKQPRMVRIFLKVYMELGSYFLFLQEQIKDIIICSSWAEICSNGGNCSRLCLTNGILYWYMRKRRSFELHSTAGASSHYPALPRISIGADVWGESSIMTGVYFNAGARLLCTSDGVCVIVYVKFSSVGAGMV